MAIFNNPKSSFINSLFTGKKIADISQTLINTRETSSKVLYMFNTFSLHDAQMHDISHYKYRSCHLFQQKIL